jgi:hypothetical protein
VAQVPCFLGTTLYLNIRAAEWTSRLEGLTLLCIGRNSMRELIRAASSKQGDLIIRYKLGHIDVMVL